MRVQGRYGGALMLVWLGTAVGLVLGRPLSRSCFPTSPSVSSSCCGVPRFRHLRFLGYGTGG